MSSQSAIAYYRVSTAQQGQSGLGLEAQRRAVETFVRTRGLTIAGEFLEVETGTNKRTRPQLQAALAAARQADAILVIAKLDRLARNVAFISSLMEAQKKDKTPFVACDMPDANSLTVHIMAALAEHEAHLISTRTREALAAAKARGKKLGSPRPMTDECRYAARVSIRNQARDAYSEVAGYIRYMRENGKSLRAISEQLNSEGKRSRNGQPWNHVQVARVLRYTAAGTTPTQL